MGDRMTRESKLTSGVDVVLCYVRSATILNIYYYHNALCPSIVLTKIWDAWLIFEVLIPS